MYQKKQKQGNGRALRIIALNVIVAAVVLLGCFGYMEYQDCCVMRARDGMEKFRETGDGEKFPAVFFCAAMAEEQIETENRQISEKLAEQWDINSELIGWLDAGENISTPVVYRDNEFYLKHDFHGNWSSSGTVFADVKNENWETDPYILLYGHNMNNGSMFGTLDQYQKLEYFVENTKVTFYSVFNDDVIEYVPFAVVDASMNEANRQYLKIRNFSVFENPEDMTEADAFIAEIRERSMIKIPEIEVTSEDKIVGMVTCSYKLPNARITVFCRALREGETAEQMEELIRENARLKE